MKTSNHRMIKNIRNIVFLGAAALGTVSAGIAYYIMSSAVGGKRQTYSEALEWQCAHYDISWFEPLEKEEYVVGSEDGYQLHCQLCRNPEKTDRCVILTHGYTDNMYGSLKYMKMYLELGFHCIIYDLRGHGENVKADCTYGVKESRDLLAVLQDARQRFPEITEFALHGESLGSATTVTALGQHPDILFAVADCGFADIENVLKGAASGFHIPSVLVKLASLMAKMRTGFAFSEMKPAAHLAGNRVPVLFIHGADDSFILPENSRRMYEATSGYAEYHEIRGAQHANSVLTDPVQYQEILKNFLETLASRGEI